MNWRSWYRYPYVVPLAAVVLAFAGCQQTPVEAPVEVAAAPNSRTVRVLFYNVQLLPLDWMNKRPDDAFRAAELGRQLAKYDLVGLSEVFEPRRRGEVIAALETAWRPDVHTLTAPDTERTAWGLDGGLVLIGKLPITASHWLAYGNGSSELEFGLGADGFANKGVLHARLTRNAFPGDDAELDLFLTHLESRESTRRDAQYGMLAKFMKQHVAADRPALLMGDLNTRGDRAAMDDAKSQYHRLLVALQSARPDWIDVGATLDPKTWGTFPADEVETARRIDYVFLSNPKAAAGLMVREVRVERFPDPRVKFLSDHAAIAATLEW